MLARLAADLVVLIHLAFILFVAAGGLIVLRRPKLAWLHLPCLAWGVLIEFGGWICPLTPLENHLRHLAGEAGYPGGFIDHYLIPIIYPAGLTHSVQIGLGLLLAAINLAIYLRLLRKIKRAG